MRIERGGAGAVSASPGAAPPASQAHSFGSVLRGSRARAAAHLSINEARALLSRAWAAIVGQAPSLATARLLTAHWALETDSGRAMPGHNFAGIKASSAANGAFFDTVEGHGATRREVRARFRVYDSPEAGARDYVSLLKKRYPAALDAARVGDLTDFCRTLAAGGYFTADPRAYSLGLRQRSENIANSDASFLSPGTGPRLPLPAAAAPVRDATAPGNERLLFEAALAHLLHAFHSASGEP